MQTIIPRRTASIMERALTNLQAWTLAAVRRARSHSQPPRLRFAEDQLDHWGDFYVRNELHKTGVRFEFFMQDPHGLQEELLRRVQMIRQMHRVRAISVPLDPEDTADIIMLKRQAD